jgi:L-ascorbate metabolism protein UlaG (beta-lactamase superfamily)
MNPEEAARAADELQARKLLPAHVGRFTIAKHPWDEPLKRIAAASEGKRPALLTPKIGEIRANPKVGRQVCGIGA